MSKYTDLQAIHRSALQHEQNSRSTLEHAVRLIVEKHLGWPDKKVGYDPIEPKGDNQRRIDDRFVIDREGTVYASLSLPVDGAPTLTVDVSITRTKEDSKTEASWLVTFGRTRIRYGGPGDGTVDDIAMHIGEIMADLTAQMNWKTWGGGA